MQTQTKSQDTIDAEYKNFLLKQSRIMDFEVRQYRLTTAELIDSGFRRDGNGNWRAES